ncbi:MAG: hypothetical protein K9H49_19830 [Bacteroidales bacterium]|nr:hypothetical protein [Bacteroidales bacterium]MCF8392060.1 hypothetical protein [Bacteroidales bacterium]
MPDIQNDGSNKGLLAYSSVYDALSYYMIKNNIDPIKIKIKAIIAMSEALNSSVKKDISRLFNTAAVSRYSNMENGIIAQQLTDGSEEFLINEASYFIEVLELNSNKPVPLGQAGRIVITDLFNYCMPMIRYDTGDVGVIEEKEVFGRLRTVFKSIEGRKMDLIYDTAGSLMSSYIITNNMWKYKEIKQYQFIQNSKKEYLFMLNTEIPFKREKELISEFSEYLGKDSQISVEYINEIPVLASGKRKKVLNNFIK